MNSWISALPIPRFFIPPAPAAPPSAPAPADERTTSLKREALPASTDLGTFRALATALDVAIEIEAQIPEATVRIRRAPHIPGALVVEVRHHPNAFEYDWGTEWFHAQPAKIVMFQGKDGHPYHNLTLVAQRLQDVAPESIIRRFADGEVAQRAAVPPVADVTAESI